MREGKGAIKLRGVREGKGTIKLQVKGGKWTVKLQVALFQLTISSILPIHLRQSSLVQFRSENNKFQTKD
jgi:hypothetical protein